MRVGRGEAKGEFPPTVSRLHPDTCFPEICVDASVNLASTLEKVFVTSRDIRQVEV